ncbi:MAG: cytochrome c family protein [Rhodospirillales bacterium]|nr:cytochrome c family protein [Rhodospirillales bacterium]
MAHLAPPEAQPEKPIAALLANANPDAGAEMARKCASCHSFDEGGPNKVGPNLHGVVGAPKAAKPGFAYSEPLKAKGGVWTYEDLNAFLARPGGFIPGTKMAFAGLSNGEDRANVIAYLRRQSPAAAPLPAPQAPPR